MFNCKSGSAEIFVSIEILTKQLFFLLFLYKAQKVKKIFVRLPPPDYSKLKIEKKIQ